MAEHLRITEDDVRLRAEPSTRSASLGSYPAGTVAEAVTEHAWRQVVVAGQTGWMAAEFLETDGSASEPSSEAPKPEDPPQAPDGGGYTFDPNTPTYLQKLDFTCSIASTIWMLRSIGIEVDPADAYDAMVPAYVSEELGLLNGDGSGIVAVLRDRWGVSAYNDWQADFDSVAKVAGRMPVALGLHNWNLRGGGHWSAVSGFDGERLILKNPAGNGPTYGQQTLSREQFDARGPASMVVILLGQ